MHTDRRSFTRIQRALPASRQTPAPVDRRLLHGASRLSGPKYRNETPEVAFTQKERIAVPFQVSADLGRPLSQYSMCSRTVSRGHSLLFRDFLPFFAESSVHSCNRHQTSLP